MRANSHLFSIHLLMREINSVRQCMYTFVLHNMHERVTTEKSSLPTMNVPLAHLIVTESRHMSILLNGQASQQNRHTTLPRTVFAFYDRSSCAVHKRMHVFRNQHFRVRLQGELSGGTRVQRRQEMHVLWKCPRII